MTIEIHSRKSIGQLIERGFPARSAVISFYEPQNGQKNVPLPVDYSALSDRVFQIPLENITYDELNAHGLTYDAYLAEGEELAEFTFAAIRDGYDILCQCEDGITLSAGCAAALYEFFCADGVSIFADYRYKPSQMVFHKVFNALWLSGKK